jgi:hypothetical protein
MIHDKHCFELYGYDLIIDSELRPWLLEVNASPSLSANTNEDYAMKTEMLHGMLDIIDMEKVLGHFLPASIACLLLTHLLCRSSLVMKSMSLDGISSMTMAILRLILTFVGTPPSLVQLSLLSKEPVTARQQKASLNCKMEERSKQKGNSLHE